MFEVFVPYSEAVPGPVAWFWEAVEVGYVPYIYDTEAAAWFGSYDADPEETPFILCPDPEERAKWAIWLLRKARAAPPTA